MHLQLAYCLQNFLKTFIEVKLIYNVVLVSGVWNLFFCLYLVTEKEMKINSIKPYNIPASVFNILHVLSHFILTIAI